jgi:HlyD family secretion protein
MLRQVRGNGTLVPEQIIWVPTLNAGRVERILVLPGAAVESNTVLVVLSNPELTKAASTAAWQLKAAEAEQTNLEVQLETQRLNLEAYLASAEASYTNAKLDAEVNAELAKDGLVPMVLMKQSQGRAEESAKLLEIEKKRVRIFADAMKAQLAVQEAKAEQLRAELQLKQQQVESLRIRAGIDGVLQKLGDQQTLQVGQQFFAGANIARVADPTRLKAEVKIYETQAKDVQLGQRASIDTRNGVIPGRVTRIDPAVENGTVTIDVALEGELPRGARPDLSVEGTVELERLEEVLHVGKPVHATADSTIGLFRVGERGREANRVPVKLGRSSVTTIEVIAGLEVGDTVILSDMSQWDGHDRIRLD